MKNKIKFIIFLSLILIILMGLNVNAYTRLCLMDCEQTPVNNPRYTCQLGSTVSCNDPGYCDVCVTDSGNPTAPYRCAGQSCSFLNPNDDPIVNETDLPILIVNLPENNVYYESSAVFFDLEVNSLSLLEYKNLDGSRVVWRDLCNDCTSYTGRVRLKEGLNHIAFRATKNSNGLIVEEERLVGVDTKKPKIKGKTLPEDKKYADGTFSVTYDEDNLISVKLYYGTSNYTVVQLENCSSGKKQTCSVDINLSNYEGQNINYYFTIEDIVGRVVNSKISNVKVDTIAPKILTLDYEVGSKSVLFDITTSEDVRKITYIDYSDRVPKERTLCSRTDHCTKKKTFRGGNHILTIMAVDEAGNFDFREIEFTV